MKKEFSKILGVGLTVALLASLILVVAPVSAGTLKWTTETIPSTTNNVLEPGANITDFDIADDGTIWAGGGQSLLYKSTDDGEAWSTVDLTGKVTANITDLVAVAPDDADIVVVADLTHNTVSVTKNAGTDWGDLGAPGCNITDIDISVESAGVHYIAAVGEDGAKAMVLTYALGAAAPNWVDAGAKADFWADDSDNSTAAAVAYSPNFASDQVMAVVTENDNGLDGTTDYIKLELYSENQDVWNAFSGYPAVITSDDYIQGLTKASISLDPEYLGSDDTMRIVFIGLTVDGGDTEADDKCGIWRMDDITAKGLKTGATVDVHSIAYDGANLVAGRRDSTTVWRSADPLATSPTVKGSASLKSPGGSGNVTVAWLGDEVVAGTMGDESAFAVSTNDGKAFSDISLIDTSLDNMRDVMVSADGSVIYMVTDNDTDTSTDTSLWRKASSWQRVLSIKDTNAEFLVRLAPDDSDVVYVAEKAGTTIYYTSDGGTARWQSRTSRSSVQDLAVEGDGDVAYVLVATDGRVSKSSNSGFTWGSSKSSKLNSGNMIVSLGEDKLLAGSKDGYVSYSTDGHSSFTKIGKQVGSTNSAVTTIASGVSDGDYVYAGLDTTGLNVYRWQIGTSTSWSDIYDDTVRPVRGMALYDGVLYVSAPDATANATSILRTLDPTDAVSVSWSTANSTTCVFGVVPQGLRVTGGSAKIWAVDNATDALYSYTDTLAILGPELVGPAQGFEVGINPISGYTMDATFSWTKPSARVTDYELRLAFDSDFAEVAKKLYPASTSSTVGYVVGHSADGEFDLMPGETYYWKVRVTTPLYSPWSVYRFVTVTEAVPPVTEVTVTPAPAPEITVEAPPPPQVTVTVPPAPTPVTPAPVIPAYLLWTIICIGAVLIIALIVLIVRTRRVV